MSDDCEEWRTMSNGKHAVSNLGRARNTKTGHVLKPTPGSHGYPTFKSAGEDGKPRTFCVHQVVAELFIGDRSGLNVNHIDGVKTNNRLTNLELVTAAGNSAHAVAMKLTAHGERHGSHTMPECIVRGSKHGAAKLTEAIVAEIRGLVATGERSCRSIAAELNISDSSVRRAARGIDWAHVPDPTETRFCAQGERIGTAKLTVALVREIRAAYATGRHTQHELARMYSVSQSTISNVTRGKVAWEHVA